MYVYICVYYYVHANMNPGWVSRQKNACFATINKQWALQLLSQVDYSFVTPADSQPPTNSNLSHHSHSTIMKSLSNDLSPRNN